jgi:hypothetical protein
MEQLLPYLGGFVLVAFSAVLLAGIVVGFYLLARDLLAGHLGVRR